MTFSFPPVGTAWIFGVRTVKLEKTTRNIITEANSTFTYFPPIWRNEVFACGIHLRLTVLDSRKKFHLSICFTSLFGRPRLMRTLNSLLAPSLFIIVAGIAFSFYSIPYYPHYDCYRKPLPYYPIQDSFVLSPVVIYPERALGVSLIVAGSIFVALILTAQTALSHFNRHRSQAIRRTIP